MWPNTYSFLRDITEAHTEADESLIRIIYIEPTASLGLDPHKILRVVKPL